MRSILRASPAVGKNATALPLTLERLAAHLPDHGADAQAQGAASDVLRYFDIAAPAHHDDEELHVFPAVRAGGDAALIAAVAWLQQDHHELARQWTALRPSLQAVADGAWEPTQAEAPVARWQAFAALYGGHIEAEEGLVFPAAAARLDTPALQRMGAEMASRRGLPAALR